jgi:hypothetical protein
MRVRIIILLVVGAILAPAHAERYALLVGNSTAQGNYTQLRYVQNDLRSLKEILGDYCGFDRQRMVTLYNGTPDDVKQSLRSFADQMAGGKNNMFLFYYSGHADAACLKMGGSDYSLDSLKQALTGFPSAIRIGIFDACQSGGFTRIKGGRLDTPFLFRDDSKTKGQVILCSSSASENAQESDALGNSVFTFYFINALRGSGDQSGDGRVTLSEAYQYAYNHTISSTAGSSGGVQHPSYQFHIQGEGDIVLADLNISSRGILLGPDLTGDVTVLSGTNAVVADLAKEKNAAVMIALGPGEYRVLNRQGDRGYQAAAVVKENAVTRVQQADFSPVATDAGRKKGEWGNDLQIGLTVSGGYGFYDLSALTSGLGERFSGYRYFSMDPRFPLPDHFTPVCVAVEGLMKKKFTGRIGFGILRNKASADYSGIYANPVDGASYGAKLHVDRSFEAAVTDLGGGYRFQNGYMKNFFVNAGLVFYAVTTKVNSHFHDSLYDVESSGNGINKAVVIVPYAAIGYIRPLAAWIDIGAQVRYRYQKSPVAGDDESNNDTTVPASVSQESAVPLRYHFGGIDGNMFVNVHFTSNIVGKLL